MILLVDTETHSLESPRVIEAAIGVIHDETDEVELHAERFNPGVPVSIKASAIHDIVDGDLAGLTPFKESLLGDMYVEANIPENYVVAHNAPFDLEAIKNEGIETKMSVIDTLRCCKHLLMDTACEEYNMQYLKYFLKLNEDPVPEALKKYLGKAHGAAADVVTLYLLFRRLASKHSLEALAALTQKTVIYNKMPFGKHKGKAIAEIIANNKGYVVWVRNNLDDRDIIASFNYHSKVASNRPK